MVNFDDFKKLDLRVGKIIEAEKVEGSDKLVRLEVDLGKDWRQIIAGIGKDYLPEDLKGTEVIVVVNLELRKIMGLESQGMLLAAEDGGKVVLLRPEKEVLPGSSVS